MTTVLSIAFPFAPVGPQLVGGAEQILSDLDTALVARGDRSLVVACQGSQPEGTLFPLELPPRESLDDADRMLCRANFHRALDRVFASHRVDLIHAHSMDLYGYEFPSEVPLLITLHLPIEWYRQETLHAYLRRARFCYVSESQKQMGLRILGDAPVIANGVQIPPAPKARKANFAVVMGRICPEKNAHAALEAGTMARTRVVIGGRVFPYRAHKAYFEEKVQPLIAASCPPVDHRFLGPLCPARRRSVLERAKCLLHPTLAPETSSLVAMEALAAGTPVIAYRSGALPEIVDDGVTGFVVDSAEEMARAISKVGSISPDRCRRAAENRFSKDRMINRYFNLYESILREGSTSGASSR